jgi:hypothetical protein
MLLNRFSPFQRERTMPHPPSRRRALVGIVVFLLLCALGYPLVRRALSVKEISADPPPFDGESTLLHQTQIVPTLDTPIQPGQNAIWCAPFQQAWKAMQKDVVKGPLQVEGAAETCDRLNNAPDASPDLPHGSSYAAAGRIDQGILAKIQRELKAAFPDASPPEFQDTASDSVIAYACLKTALQFPLPYFEETHALKFVEGAGRTVPIRAFGIRPEDDYAYRELRQQLKVLYASGDDALETLQGASGTGVDEFVIDLCRDSQPNQVVIARVHREASLAATLAAVEKKIASAPTLPGSQGTRGLGSNDVLLIPKIQWHIVHHFKEVEGHRVSSPKLAAFPMVLAMQDIQFRLDRGGVELASEAKIHVKPVPSFYLANRPFLVYVKKRGADHPFFAIWVENAELLTHTSAQKE